MRSNFRKLRHYIRQIDLRNTAGREGNLLGVSTRKVFIQSVANTVGTNFKRYKVVKRNQFTYVPDTSRRGDKIGLAMLTHLDEAIVSQAYTVFEVMDTDQLDPEYLMMWFRRPEFDRYARYMSHGSVREIFGWEEMCDVELPVPDIDIQKAIVREYKVIVDRITLNEEICINLENKAQALYKFWFVDFEFPMSAEYALGLGKPMLTGSPYKSSGGALEYCNEKEKIIPIVCTTDKLEKILDFKNGKSRPPTKGLVPVYGGNGIMDYVSTSNNNDALVIGRVGAYCGSLYKVKGPFWVSDNAILAKSKTDCDSFCFYLLKSMKLNSRSEGTGQPLLTQGILNNLFTIHPPEDAIKRFDNMASKLLDHIHLLQTENQKLSYLESVVLSKLANTNQTQAA